MQRTDIDGTVALVTGGASGIGAAVAAGLAGLGAKVVVADVDAEHGEAVAADIDGTFVRCDVSDLDDVEAAVAVAEDVYGGLDIVHLNAGIVTGCGVGDDFDLALYRRAMGVNLDGVVFGTHAALPALRRRGGGAIVATSSMAGLVSVPFDPVYAANKHGVVGLVRSLAPVLAADGITIGAICPAFADTPILGEMRNVLVDNGVPLIPVDRVFEAVLQAMEGRSGDCWYVQPGRPAAPFPFNRPPGPLTDAGERAPYNAPQAML